MNTHVRSVSVLSLLSVVVILASCGGAPEMEIQLTPGLTAFTGARLIIGDDSTVVENGTLVVRDGRIEVAGASDAVEIPADAEQIDVSGKTIIPGLINAHGHVNNVRGLESDPAFYTEEHVESQLGLYARYGVTTVFSLGGGGAAGVAVRDRQGADLNHARLYLSGDVITGDSAEEVATKVNAMADLGVDLIKIRVDDNLGNTDKMPPEIYSAVIDTATERDLTVAAHLYYLDDAKGLLNAGADLIAHSVRDVEVDDELVTLLLENNVCYCPTLMREVSTYVYESRPDWFDEPFFLKEADAAVIEGLSTSEYQEGIQNSSSAQAYKEALEMAKTNLKTLSDAGVGIAMGTDTGPAGRFQGYFEHGELALMVESGLSPLRTIAASTGEAARCMGIGDELGTLEAGKLADFVILGANPLDDIRNSTTIESVWVAGNQVPGV
jgi:imidazolonepropionase-like amidohydrolase